MSTSFMASKKYKAFISHRGTETKHTVAFPLYDMLRDRGMEVFFDTTEMEGGGGVSQQIIDAISTSEVQIAIISPAYGESTWCLDELLMMVEKHRSKTSLLIPVFYGVEPSHVRFLKGDFGERFYGKHTKRQPPEKIEEWKQALKEIADISGYAWDQHKGALIRIIVDRVCRHTHSGKLHIPGYVIGIKEQLVEKEEEIMRPRETVSFAKITGIGGIGKTTFAKALFNNIYSRFEKYCFVDDVKGLLDKHGIIHLQKFLFKSLLHFDISLTNSSNGKYELEKRLINEKILLVLDNIDETMRLSDIFMENYELLSPFSKIIVTSRDICVLRDIDQCKVISLEIPKLDFYQSEKLFCSQAFGSGVSKFYEENRDLVLKIVKKYEGIPLALVLFGRHIFNLDISNQKVFLEAYKDAMPSDLRDSFLLTYNSLDEELQKRIFLDVAIFFHGEKVALLRNMWGDHASQFELALDKLKRKLLIEITENDHLRMHDILRDLGRAIIDTKELNPGCRSHLWRRPDIISVLSEKTGTDKVEGLSLLSEGEVILDEDEDGEPCPWDVDGFVMMPSLRVLNLHSKCIQRDLSKLPKGIRFLRWTEYPYDSISLPLMSARVIDFSNGELTGLWDLRSKEAPVKLIELRLRRCYKLNKIEFNRRFRFLRDLNLYGCVKLQIIPESITHLEALEHLNLKHCGLLESLPDVLGNLRNLKSLKVTGCTQLKSLPRTLGDLKQLQTLQLDGSFPLNTLPPSFGLLENLNTAFPVFQCVNEGKLPDSLAKQLRVLEFQGCCSWEMLPESFYGQPRNLIGNSPLHCSRSLKLTKIPNLYWKISQRCEVIEEGKLTRWFEMRLKCSMKFFYPQLCEAVLEIRLIKDDN